MPLIKISDVVPYTPSEMFDLVADIDRYQEFLPWCTGSRILRVEGSDIFGLIEVGHGKIKTAFTTRNRNSPGKSIEFQLVDGPLKSLEGSWRFEALPEGGTRVTLELTVEPGKMVLFSFTEALLAYATKRLTSAFRDRAEAVYGEKR